MPKTKRVAARGEIGPVETKLTIWESLRAAHYNFSVNLFTSATLTALQYTHQLTSLGISKWPNQLFWKWFEGHAHNTMLSDTRTITGPGGKLSSYPHQQQTQQGLSNSALSDNPSSRWSDQSGLAVSSLGMSASPSLSMGESSTTYDDPLCQYTAIKSDTNQLAWVKTREQSKRYILLDPTLVMISTSYHCWTAEGAPLEQFYVPPATSRIRDRFIRSWHQTILINCLRHFWMQTSRSQMNRESISAPSSVVKATTGRN